MAFYNRRFGSICGYDYRNGKNNRNVTYKLPTSQKELKKYS